MAGTFSISYVSINDSGKAEEIARLLVQQKLAACIQILPQVTSIYSWKGKIEKESELLMVIKSRTSMLPKMTSVIVANHPYEVCEVVSVPVSTARYISFSGADDLIRPIHTQITQGNPAYMKWLGEQVPDPND